MQQLLFYKKNVVLFYMSLTYDDFLDFIFNHKIKMVLGIFFLIVLVVLIVYLNVDRSHSVLFSSQNVFYNNEQYLIGFEQMPLSNENIKYTFSVFIRINNISGNSVFNDFTQGKTILDNGGSPNIIFYPNTGIVDIEIGYKNNEGVNDTYNFNLRKLPMQKWIGLCVVVDGKIVKIYVDGHLYTAKKMNTIPLRSRKMLSIGKDNENFNGNIGMIDYYNRSLNETEVKKIFKKRIKSLPDEVLTYEQMEYKKRLKADMDKKLNKIKMI